MEKKQLINPVLEIVANIRVYFAVYQCLCTQVRDWWKVLAYCAQFNNLLPCTDACSSCGNFHTKKAFSSIKLDVSSSSYDASLQCILQEALSTHFYRLLCSGMLHCSHVPSSHVKNDR